MFVGHLYVFFGKILYRSSAHFFYWIVCFLILSYMSCLYILEINSLLHLWMCMLVIQSLFVTPWTADIFSHSEGCHFILFKTYIRLTFIVIYYFSNFTLVEELIILLSNEIKMINHGKG